MTGSQSHKGMKVRWDDVMLRSGYHPLTAYKQSKLCDMLLAKGINDRYCGEGVRAYVVDPGLVNTQIGNKAGGLVRFVWKWQKRHGIQPAVAAQTYAYLCGEAQPPKGLYYAKCRQKAYSREVTQQNADRLYALSQRLCGIQEGRDGR